MLVAIVGSAPTAFHLVKAKQEPVVQNKLLPQLECLRLLWQFQKLEQQQGVCSPGAMLSVHLPELCHSRFISFLDHSRLKNCGLHIFFDIISPSLDHQISTLQLKTVQHQAVQKGVLEILLTTDSMLNHSRRASSPWILDWSLRNQTYGMYSAHAPSTGSLITVYHRNIFETSFHGLHLFMSLALPP